MISFLFLTALKIFGKWSEIFGKSLKTIISYNEKEITWSLLMLKILEEKFDIYAQPCNILYFYITKISASLLLSK